MAVRRAAAVLNAAAPARLRVSGVIVRAEPLPRTAVGKIRRRAIAESITRAGVTS
jgi:acyl-coenzyme A synthetase/AMP-(fatty) acid ligase